MDNENFAFIYGRINTIEYLLQSLVVAQLGQVNDKVATINQYRDLARRDIAKMKVAGGDRASLEAVHAEMKASLERWFDALLAQLATSPQNPLSPSGSNRPH